MLPAEAYNIHIGITWGIVHVVYPELPGDIEHVELSLSQCRATVDTTGKTLKQHRINILFVECLV